MGFRHKEISFYAASLSFYTIFALLPVLLIVFSILTYLPAFEIYYVQIKELVLSHLAPTNTLLVAEYLDGLIANAPKIGIIGFAYVFFASILFFNNYQYVSAHVFESTPRDFWSSLSVYWTLITLLPIGLALSFYLSSEYAWVFGDGGEQRVGRLMPYLLVWGLFLLLFRISANKAIDFRALVMTSFATACVWLFSKWAFVSYVFTNKHYASLYGSLSSLLFFMFWIYLSWLVVLYGMVLCVRVSTRFDASNDL